MKKIQLFVALICYILSFFTIEAKRIDVEKAEKVARSYARTTVRLTERRDFKLTKTVSRQIVRKRTDKQSITSQQQQNEPMFYVFTMNGNGGFVIISGDDIAKPILGYSDNGTYDENNPNLAYWMETLSQEIADAVENGIAQDEQTKAEWEAFESESKATAAASGGDFVDPLITTRWDQEAPYNNLCPQISRTRTATGCVATTMAQIMRFHRYPTTRTKTIPGYTTQTKRITVPAIAGTFTYKWDDMTDIYTSSSSKASQDAVAELIYHCGVGVQMDYGLASDNGSGASSSDVAPALKDYFGYDAGIAHHYREYYTYSEWTNMLKTEIKAGRPVYYSGSNNDSGHAFVCDGYDAGGLFHFNWGWSGSSDGYFEISALNPNSTGTGGSSKGYNQLQEIVTGIQPDKGGEAIVQLYLSKFYANKTLLNSLSETFDITMEELGNIGS
ncbi:MAG: C10 family peptidase, partial [Prevotellaceae bacterium]|nr:C10 family peptidase [Prevotellaceae bacterium]